MSKGTTTAWALLAIMLTILLAPLAAVAGAQEDTPDTTDTTVQGEAAGDPDAEPAGEIRGTLRAGRDIVVGAGITVIGPEGDVIAELISGDDGRWTAPITELGDYQVLLDIESLPEGVGLRSDAPAEVIITVDQLVRPANAAFGLEAGGTSIVAIDPTWQRLLNRCVSGLKVGLLIALAAVGLSLIFGVTGLVNFAHSELVAFGAVMAWAIESWTPLPFLLVILAAVMVGGALGFVLEVGLFSPLRKRKMNNVSLMVVSIGLAFILRYMILIYFGTGQRTYESFRIQTNYDIGPISLPPKDYFIILTAFLMLVGVGLLLQRTKLGTAMRAVSDNPPLARSSGINVDRTILAVWIMGAALAALGGVLLGLTQVVEWQMGERVLLLIFAAVTLGGLGTAYGAMLGGLAIGFASEVSTFWLDNDLKFLVALVALIVILLVRPQGILGVRERLG